MSTVTVTTYDAKEVFYFADKVYYDDYGNLVVRFKEEGHVTYIPVPRVLQVDVR